MRKKSKAGPGSQRRRPGNLDAVLRLGGWGSQCRAWGESSQAEGLASGRPWGNGTVCRENRKKSRRWIGELGAPGSHTKPARNSDHSTGLVLGKATWACTSWFMDLKPHSSAPGRMYLKEEIIDARRASGCCAPTGWWCCLGQGWRKGLVG